MNVVDANEPMRASCWVPESGSIIARPQWYSPKGRDRSMQGPVEFDLWDRPLEVN